MVVQLYYRSAGAGWGARVPERDVRNVVDEVVREALKPGALKGGAIAEAVWLPERGRRAAELESGTPLLSLS
jgi:hypothetical protein